MRRTTRAERVRPWRAVCLSGCCVFRCQIRGSAIATRGLFRMELHVVARPVLSARPSGNETFELLARRRATMCLHDKRGSAVTGPMVGPFTDVRFHGASGHYHGSYSRRQLERWAHVLAEHTHAGRRVFAYFNNDPDAVATKNALTPREMIERLI